MRSLALVLFIFPSEHTRKFIFVIGERRKFKKCRGISYIVVAFLIFFAGCESMQADNINWVKENNIEYEIIKIPDNLWTAVAKNNGFSPDVPCFFTPPKYITIREGTYTAFIFEGIRIQRTYEEYCLNHELGHLREYLEGVPYHSKYAR